MFVKRQNLLDCNKLEASSLQKVRGGYIERGRSGKVVKVISGSTVKLEVARLQSSSVKESTVRC